MIKGDGHMFLKDTNLLYNQDGSTQEKYSDVDGSFVNWSDLEHVQDVEVGDVASLNRKLTELYEMDFVVKVEQLRYKRLMYVGSPFGGFEKYLIKIYKQKDQ